MIESSKSYPMLQIFARDEKIKYVIPKFQREYIWRKENWEEIFNDLIEEPMGHFLGSIICVNRQNDTLAIKPLDLIDGQQRLTTISLAYCAIFKCLVDAAEKEKEKDNEEYITEKTNLKNALLQKGTSDEIKIELSYQNKNYEDYKYVLKEIGILSRAEKPANLGNRRIYKCYSFFLERVENYKYKELLDFLNKVNAALVVKIEVKNNSDAFALFESLNNRGIPLSAIDIIKNNMLAKLEKKDILKIDDAFEDWKQLVDNLPDYTIQERFLRQYYNAFRYKDNIKIKGQAKATRSNLIQIYEKLIDTQPEHIFNELKHKSSIYFRLVSPQKDDEYFEEFIDLVNVGAAPSYLFLMYLFSEFGKDNSLLKSTLKFMVKYFLRRNVTDFPRTRDLDSIFMGLVDYCEENNKQLDGDKIIKYLKNKQRYANDSDFIEKLKGDLYEENTDAARFILCKIEESEMTRENRKDLWERESNKYKWTIEHIFPEGRNIPKEWVDMVANGEKEKAEILQEEYVHKIGNLTLTVYNSSLSNFSFEKKRDRIDKNRRFIGYKNGLYLNSKLKSMNKWTIKDIIDRTEKIVNKAVVLFS